MTSGLKINLLPPEILAQEFKRAKFYKVQAAGVAVILGLIFLTALTLALRILQSRNMSEVQAKVTQEEQAVSDQKNTQAALVVLNDRLKVIDQYWGVASKQSAMYELINKLIPSSVTATAVTIDKGGEAVFAALAPDSLTLDSLVTNLTDKESNEGKISQVSVDSLNRGRDGFYRVTFKVKP